MCQVRIFRKRSRNQSRSGRVQDMELSLKQTRYALHHRLYPVRVLLCSNAVLDHGVQKGMTGHGAEAVIADFPIHLVLAAQIPAERQFLERKHATVRKQLVQPGGKKNIGIEIKSSEAKNSQIAEEIIFLDPERESSSKTCRYSGNSASMKATTSSSSKNRYSKSGFKHLRFAVAAFAKSGRSRLLPVWMIRAGILLSSKQSQSKRSGLYGVLLSDGCQLVHQRKAFWKRGWCRKAV